MKQMEHVSIEGFDTELKLHLSADTDVRPLNCAVHTVCGVQTHKHSLGNSNNLYSKPKCMKLLSCQQECINEHNITRHIKE